MIYQPNSEGIAIYIHEEPCGKHLLRIVKTFDTRGYRVLSSGLYLVDNPQVSAVRFVGDGKGGGTSANWRGLDAGVGLDVIVAETLDYCLYLNPNGGYAFLPPGELLNLERLTPDQFPTYPDIDSAYENQCPKFSQDDNLARILTHPFPAVRVTPTTSELFVWHSTDGYGIAENEAEARCKSWLAYIEGGGKGFVPMTDKEAPE